MSSYRLPMMRLFLVALLLMVLNLGLYALQNPKVIQRLPASVVSPETVFVNGFVKDAANHTLLSGVHVATGKLTATTNSRGEFVFPLSGDIYTIDFQKDGYLTERISIDLSNGQNQSISIDLKHK